MDGMTRTMKISVCILTLFTLLLAGCGTGAPADPAADVPPPTPTAIPAAAVADTIEAALQKTRDATTYGVQMDMSLKGNLEELGAMADPDEEFSLVNMTADIDGDNAQISMTGLFASFMGIDEDQALEMLVVDEQTYIRGPLPLLGASESAWYIMDEDNGAVPFEPESMFGSFTDESIDVSGFTSTGSEQLDDQQCTVFTATDEDALKALAQTNDESGLLPTDMEDIERAEFKIWVCADGYVHQFLITAEGAESDESDELITMTMRMGLSDFGQAMNISAPADALPLDNELSFLDDDLLELEELPEIDTPDMTDESATTNQTTTSTRYPLPPVVENLMEIEADDSINFQTTLSIAEAMEFYRQEFIGDGATEREIVTVVTDTTFSMVFDGWADDGRAVVVQGVELAPGELNLNIRVEEV